jgi:hypothetical protein
VVESAEERGTSDARPGRALVLVLATLLGAAALFSVAGCGATTYVDATQGFSLTHDGSLTVCPDVRSDAQVGPPPVYQVALLDLKRAKVGGTYTDGVVVAVFRLQPSSPRGATAQQRAALTASLGGQMRGALPQSSVGVARAASVGGLRGFSMPYSYSVDGTRVRATTYVVFAGDREYQITAQCEASRWQTAGASLERTARSFRLMEASPAK